MDAAADLEESTWMELDSEAVMDAEENFNTAR